MTPQAWRRVGELFHDAVQVPEENRAEWAAEACAGDPDLLRELSSLLESDRQAREGFVHEKVRAGVVDFVEYDARSRAPQRAGPYRLVRELGRGGMGTVYLGERDDDQYNIDVAVKLVTPGMDTAFVLQRFRRERQILAGFDHPHIARLLDGGATDEGLPYIVMQYVDGIQITEYCRRRELDVRRRLHLFLDVCAAVEYAHRHFVVHRDIKPGNILVTEAGTVKLLDFGICKLLHTDGLRTSETLGEARLLTPDYASPEQVRGEAVTVASDVYSLGAVLYEVLTGVKPHPFANATLLEIERIICEKPVTRPSLAVQDKGVARELTGDLDTILLRAMHKDPQRRYPAVEEFANDLERYLADLPVKAVADALGYRFGKFLRRRAGIVAVAATALLVMAGAIVDADSKTRLAERLRIRLAIADVRIGRLSNAQRDRTQAAAALAEARRISAPLLQKAGSNVDADLDMLQTAMKELEADLAVPSQP